MKKKLWSVIAIILVVGAIALVWGKVSAASAKKEDSTPKNPSAPSEYQFDATVLEIQDDYIMVEALEGQTVAGEVRVQIGLLTAEQVPEIKIGDVVRITHDGKMTMSIPPQMTAVEGIEIIDKK